MGESYDGITVPDGDPDGLRAAAHSLHGIAGLLGGTAGRLGGLPGSLAAWQGPASVSYAGSCTTNAGAAHACGTAIGEAAGVSSAFASTLESAQQRARKAIREARDAQHRIDAALNEIRAAQAAAAAAQARGDAAADAIAVSSLAGAPSPSALAEQRQAADDASAAASAETRARHDLEHAREDLRRAKKDGHDAEEDARLAARGAEAAFGAVAFGVPAAMPGGAAMAHGGNGGAPGFWQGMWDTNNEGLQWWNEDAFVGALVPFAPSNDSFAGKKWFGDQLTGFGLGVAGGAAGNTARAWQQAASTSVRYERLTMGAFRTTINGRPALVTYASRTTAEIGPTAETIATAGRWAKLSKGIPVAGTVIGMGSAGWDQWRADSSNANLTTTDRVGRAAGVGVYVGGAAAAGGAIGTMIFPGVGTLAGAGIGAAGGLLVGAAASAWEPGKHAAAWVGQHVANGVVDGAQGVAHGAEAAYHWTDHQIHAGIDLANQTADKLHDLGSGAVHTAGDVLDDLNPF